MERLLKAIFLLSCVGGILSIALLLLSPLTKRGLSPRWQHRIWLCVLVVMVLPIRLELPGLADLIATKSPAQDMLQDVFTQPGVSPPPALQQADLLPQGEADPGLMPRLFSSLPWVWALGGLLCFCFGLFSYLRFLQGIRKFSWPIPCPALDEVKAELRVHQRIRVRAMDRTCAPLVAGLFRPVLLLPEDAEGTQLRHILSHELIHIRRHDLWFKWFALLVRCVYWFNPLVYLVCRQMDEACEMACDLAVTGGMDEVEKRDYMRTILSLARPAAVEVPRFSMSGGGAQLARRFAVIQSAKKPFLPAVLLSVLAVLSLLSASLLASGAAAGAMEHTGAETPVIAVYNGSAKLSFTNSPFLENNEIYLPLRETLNQFGIHDIRWEDGSIYIALPLLEAYKGFAVQERSCRLTVGVANIKYLGTASYRNGVFGESPGAGGYALRYPPIVRDSVTYATVEFFEDLITRGQIPRFRVHLLQASDPKRYCAEGEQVFIGTGAEQKGYRPVDENGDPLFVKRIVTNEKGEAMLVVTAENQRPEIIANAPTVNAASMDECYKLRVRTFCYNAYGESVIHSSGIFVYEQISDEEFLYTAYIPPALQINCYAYNSIQ